MTLNGHFELESVSGSATNRWRLRLSDKTVRKFAELPIYCQRQKCSPGNVVSDSIKFMQIFAGVRWRGGVNWKRGGWKWRFSLHSLTVFRTFYIHGHTTAFWWYDCQWPWAYFKAIWLFHIKFLKNGVWYGKRYYWQLIGNHTLAVDWCHFWWPWSTFEGHFSLACPFHVHFSYPWHAFASHGLPAIAELLVLILLLLHSQEAGVKLTTPFPLHLLPHYLVKVECSTVRWPTFSYV